MKRFISPMLVLMLLSVICGRCYGAEPKVEAVQFAERVVYHSPQTPGYTAWVGLWQLPDGRLRWDCLQLTGTKAKPVATVPVFESRDGADTWTRVVNTATEAVLSAGGYLTVSRDSGRGMAVLPNGTLVRPVWPPEDEKTSGWIERSTDGGKTWGQKIFFLAPAEYRTWPTLIRNLRDGRLVLFAGCWKRGDQQSGAGALPNMTKMMFVSSDEGKTWGQPIVVMPTKQGVCEESDFCELPGGDLFFVHRTEHFPDHRTEVSPLAARMGSSPPQSYWYSDRMQSVVRKQGASFVPGPCEPAALAHSGYPAVLRTRDGVILHLATTGVHWTVDLGKTWTRLDIPGTPYYPKALERPDGTIVVLGHVGSDDPYGTVDQSIKQQTFRLRATGRETWYGRDARPTNLPLARDRPPLSTHCSFLSSPLRLESAMNVFATLAISALLTSAVPPGPAAADGWTVLSNDFTTFQQPTGKWYIAGGARMNPKFERRLVGEPGRGTLINGKIGVTDNLITRQQWGDAEVSLDFMIPRGSNSGVKLHGVYEIQIFDSWKVAKPTGADCGGIYPRAELRPSYHHIDDGIAPRVNAAKAPGEWQTLSIRFRAPRFDHEGRKIANARFEKVVLNGKLIHDNVQMDHPTGNVWRDKEHAKGPLLFQADHGPVAFRNIRVRPLAAAPPPKKGELQEADFNFHGPLGSDGARLVRIGVNHFQLTLGHAPTHPAWANIVQFEVLRHAFGNRLRLDVRFDNAKPQYLFDDYPLSWSCDRRNWWQIRWSPGGVKGKARTLEFPEFPADRIIVGHQAPMSYDDAERLIAGWRRHPHVQVHVLGKSLEGRNLYRLTITDPASPHRPARRWVHHVANQHPLECCSQWRMAGMIDWLLSEQAAEVRQRTICHFTLMMSPDSASHGWYRTNSQGFDMNRTYRAEGADGAKQAHEAYVFQSDLEALMRSEAPVTSSWEMHTWQGLMDPIIRGQGPEMGRDVGPWEDLKKLLAKYDTQKLSKPLTAVAEPNPEGHWDCGLFRQFGITNVLVEGGSHCDMQQNLDSGEALMRAIVEYYRGLRPAR